ncbi:MAG: YdcF family protein [Anaerolineae bacterium]|nr:YdcF family protein [Anaerolineae bacterium]
MILKRLLRWSWRLFRWWLVFALLLMGVIFIYGRVDRAESADAIVVLGAGLSPSGRPGPALIRRTDQALALWERGLAEHVICTGGIPYRATRSEASACGELLRASGIPAEAIFLEEESHSTEENALYTHALMAEQGWNSAIVVSDGYHLLRATWLFQLEGIPNVTSPAVDPPPGNHLFSMGREVVALHWQVVKDLLGLPVTYVPVL